MLKVENIESWGFKNAIRGMRNPLNSWDKSDSGYIASGKRYENVDFVVGNNDLELMKKLVKSGSAHRKFLRQIFISMDITAPLYWWKEFDTYKVGTVANSCSTMHCIHKKEFTLDDFSHEHLEEHNLKILEAVILALNTERYNYNFGKQKSQWWQMTQLLPTSYNQKRTVTMDYENALNIIRQRKGHKLDEWLSFCEYLQGLPYMSEFLAAL